MRESVDSRGHKGRNAARLWSAALCGALLLTSPASAQQKEPGSYDRAIAAGYKALTLCSGMFNAGRTQSQIESLELTGIYPEYDALLPKLAARIDGEQKRVEVPFDKVLPPRVAAWQPIFGCTVLPIGSAPGTIRPALGLIALRPKSRAEQPWPLGDRNAAAAPRGGARALAAAVDRALVQPTYGAGSRTTAVVVVQNGKIVAERYRDGFGPTVAQRTWSVAKSLTGTLIGHAVHRGLLNVGDPAPLPEWRTPGDPRGAITTDDLLRMASGLHSDSAGNRTDAIYFGGTAVTEQATGWPIEVQPGTRFRYANNDTLLAVRGLRAKLREQDEEASFVDAFFATLGMTHTTAETDWQGNYVLSSQVWSTARDLARFGLLYLDDGVWNGKRLLPEGWVKYVTTPSGPQPEGDFGYGATFWLLNTSPGVPADTFAAFGNRGQYVVIVPSRRIVIVRRGEDPTGARFDIAKFTADMLANLK